MLYNNQGILSFYSKIICEQTGIPIIRNKQELLILRGAKQKERLRAKGGGSCLVNYCRV